MNCISPCKACVFPAPVAAGFINHMQHDGDKGCCTNVDLYEDHVYTGVAVRVVMVVEDHFHSVLPYLELVLSIFAVGVCPTSED